jgi:hypothetical protein
VRYRFFVNNIPETRNKLVFFLFFSRYHAAFAFKKTPFDRCALYRDPVFVVGMETFLCGQSILEHAVGLEDALCQLDADLLAA